MSENGILGCTLKALIYKLFQLTGPIRPSAGRKGGKIHETATEEIYGKQENAYVC